LFLEKLIINLQCIVAQLKQLVIFAKSTHHETPDEERRDYHESFLGEGTFIRERTSRTVSGTQAACQHTEYTGSDTPGEGIHRP
jgi:hypothetical protein